MSHNVEIAVELEVQASLAFWVDKEEWDAKSDEEKRQEILKNINLVNGELSDDVLRFKAGANISVSLLGPDGKDKPVELDKLEIYDPQN